MISNVNKNVIFVKDIPSNIIEEAIFILKEETINDREYEKIAIAKGEAELFLQDYVEEEVKEIAKKRAERKDQRKIINILACAIGAIAIVLVISFVL